MSTLTPAQLESELAALRARVAELECERRHTVLADQCPSTKLLESVLTHMPLVLWSVDREGVFTMSRGKGLEVLGLQSGEVNGRSIFELYGDFPEVLRDVRRALAGEEFHSAIEIKSLHFDGWYSPILDEHSAVTGVLGIASVVTERVRAEAALEKSEERFSKAFHSSPVAILITRLKDGKFVDVNRAFEKISGYSRDEVIGRLPHELNVWVEPHQRAAMMEALRSRGSLCCQEYQFRKKDDTQVTASVSAELIDLDGDACVLTAAEDISDRKAAEEALRKLNEELESRVKRQADVLRRGSEILQEQIRERRRVLNALCESEEKWRSVVENAPDFILSVSRDGIIESINRTLPHLSKDDVIGSSVLDFIPPEQHTRITEVIQHVIDTGETVSIEHTAEGPGGLDSCYASRIGPIKRNKDVVSLIVIATDITTQKEAEETVRQKLVELAHAARLNTVGEMTAILAHELNNPLGAISNYAHGCIRRLETGPIQREDMVEVMREVAVQSNRASDIIRRLRSFVRKQDIQYTEADPFLLVEEAIQLVLPEAHRNHVMIRIESTQAIPNVMVDKVQIEQVLVNLLLNAVDATETASLESCEVKVSLTPITPSEIMISVRDVGHGLSDDFPDWIFEPFRSSKPSGLGIGLSISRSIMETHGGRLWAEQNEGPGATFHMTLPIWAGGNPDD